MRESGLVRSSYTFKAQTETSVALGHGDQSSSEPTKGLRQ